MPSTRIVVCCESVVEASEFLFKFLVVKVGLILFQKYVAEDGEANHHNWENAGKWEIIVVACSNKLWLLEPQHNPNREVKVALNQECECWPPDEVWLQLCFNPIAQGVVFSEDESKSVQKVHEKDQMHNQVART